MKIVGVGCGPGLLTEQAAQAIRAASHIVGSERAIALARQVISGTSIVQEIEDYKALRTLPDDTVLLSTGDPMLSGLGYLPGEVIPGISSVQLGAARLHIPLTRLIVLTAHGRGHHEAILTAAEEMAKKRIICLITDPGFNIPQTIAYLKEFPTYRVIICQDIGYPEEEIRTGTVQNPPEPSSGLFIVFFLPPE